MPLTPEEIAPCNCNAGVSGTASHHEWFCAEQFQDRIAFAIAAAVKEERAACVEIVQKAREGEYDNDLRSIISRIRTREGS